MFLAIRSKTHKTSHSCLYSPYWSESYNFRVHLEACNYYSSVKWQSLY